MAFDRDKENNFILLVKFRCITGDYHSCCDYVKVRPLLD